jgi:hypothetical protein
MWLIWFGVPYALVALFGMGQTFRDTRCALAIWNSRRELPKATTVVQGFFFLAAILTNWLTYGVTMFLAFRIITAKDAFSDVFTYPPVIDILKDIVALT